MKRVKCKSGLTGSQMRLQDNYTSFNVFKEYCRTYNIHGRLGYGTMKSAWESNPTIQLSVEPSDLSIVFFHVIKGKNSLRIKESTERYCTNVNSIACFSNRDGALSYLNSTTLK